MCGVLYSLFAWGLVGLAAVVDSVAVVYEKVDKSLFGPEPEDPRLFRYLDED